MKQIARYAVTASYLRPRQVGHRLKSVPRRYFLHPSRTYRARYTRRATGEEGYEPIVFDNVRCEAFDLKQIDKGCFTFLNHTVHLGDPVNWLPENEVRLWLYNLHYWHYATTLGCEFAGENDDQAYLLFRRLARQWIDRCPVATPTVWDAYPTSLRLANWLRCYSLFRPRLEQDDEFAAQFRRSLYVQACFLEDHLEYDLLNNHLLENGRALLLAGLFFEGQDADRWRRKGENILMTGLEENFLSDGGLDELSPMYHQAMLEMYDEVYSVLKANDHDAPQMLPGGLLGRLSGRLQQLREWLVCVCHPDGEIALLNDAALNVVQPTRETLQGVSPPQDGLTVLQPSGYFIFRDQAKENFLIFDCGPIGPDHQPGHGHCDALSYELSLAGQRMIVDSGVDAYHGDLNWRNYFRSTRAHNTLVVDGAEQSEIWDRFRVARRAKPLYPVWSDKDEKLAFAGGSHSGYLRLKESLVHRRWVCWVDRKFWLVCDRVVARKPTGGVHRLENLIHFHPDATVVCPPRVGPTEGFGANGQSTVGEIRRGEVALKIAPWGAQGVSKYYGEHDPIQGWYAPEFGLRQRNHVWGLTYEGKLPAWMGYVLWPEPTHNGFGPTVKVSPRGEDSCQVAVQDGDNLYEIHINQHEIHLEGPA